MVLFTMKALNCITYLYDATAVNIPEDTAGHILEDIATAG